MLHFMTSRGSKSPLMVFLMCLLSGILYPAAPARAQQPVPSLTLDAAIRLGLEQNPELMALRQQHGIAEAGIVIARTYPFNPVLESKVRSASGPEGAGVTNVLSNEHKVFMDVELKGQSRIRREAAAAVLSRTDWEIAAQETALAIRVARAFDTTLNRYEKVKLIREAIEENARAVQQVEKLVNASQLNPGDLIIIRTELDDVTAQLQSGESTFITAAHEFYRALGIVNVQYQLVPTMPLPLQTFDAETMVETALKHRADLQARQFVVSEMGAKLRLEVANRFGNPNFGPAFEYDPTRVTLIGVQLTLPLPAFNQHRGEIMQRQAELSRATLELRQTEVQVKQDVYAALARLEKAQTWLDTYRKHVIPNLNKALADVKKLIEVPKSGVDALRVIDVQRKQLKARDSELDALLEVRQALADLAAAVGDPNIAVTASPTP